MKHDDNRNVEQDYHESFERKNEIDCQSTGKYKKYWKKLKKKFFYWNFSLNAIKLKDFNQNTCFWLEYLTQLWNQRMKNEKIKKLEYKKSKDIPLHVRSISISTKKPTFDQIIFMQIRDNSLRMRGYSLKFKFQKYLIIKMIQNCLPMKNLAPHLITWQKPPITIKRIEDAARPNRTANR